MKWPHKYYNLPFPAFYIFIGFEIFVLMEEYKTYGWAGVLFQAFLFLVFYKLGLMVRKI